MKQKEESFIKSSTLEGPLLQPKDTKYMLTGKGTKKYKKSKVEITCEWCGKKALTVKAGKSTARFCGKSCAAYYKNSNPEIRAKMDAHKKPQIQMKKCEWCNEDFPVNKKLKRDFVRRFCNQSCSAKWRMSQPGATDFVKTEEFSRRARERAIEQMRDPALRAMHSKRMTKNNPMAVAETREKVSRALSGRPFSGERMGNGHITKPQRILWQALGLGFKSLEYPVLMKEAKGENLPYCYKIDIALIKEKIAIEVDGASHKAYRVKKVDTKRTIALNSLGWRVVRFKNEEILNNLDSVVEKVSRFMTSK